ncbi:MAG: hypothetical protein Q4C60_07590 [Eubacteriales bacterium]|nr:hypothetical protein [Eubacteriales bacterium]
MAENYQRPEIVAQLFGISVRRVQQLTQEGVLHSEKVAGKSGKMYDLIPTIQSYVQYLSDKAYNRKMSDKEAELKEQKLTAEIALKESQTELHQLRTDIAKGKYIAVEEVQLDYRRFFVVLKKFVLGVPNRVAGMISGYVDPVTARAIEKDMSREAAELLRGFVLAAKEEAGDSEKT